MIGSRSGLSPSDSTARGGRQLVDVDELTQGRSTAGDVSALAPKAGAAACSTTAASMAAGPRPRRRSSTRREPYRGRARSARRGARHDGCSAAEAGVQQGCTPLAIRVPIRETIHRARIV